MTTTNVNYWTGFESGEGFLDYLRDSSNARRFCRRLICEMIEAKKVASLLEVGIGGLNEITSLDPILQKHSQVVYRGTDWTPKFLENARAKFPGYQFSKLDITQCGCPPELESDLVYSQHVLEHCPGLNPPLSNMLQLARKVLVNIFFIPPAEQEYIDFHHYPLYHNRYAIHHIMKVCGHHGFTAKLYPFSNAGDPGARECQEETVLVAERIA